MEQDGTQLVRRFARRAGYGLYLRLEHAAHRPVAVAQGARELQTVPTPSEPGELEPGSGHRADEERDGTPEPVAWMLVGDGAAHSGRPPLHRFDRTSDADSAS